MELLRRYQPQFLARRAERIAPRVRAVLERIELCRTRVLGGHEYACTACGERCLLYNSCRDRHCPQCRGAQRGDWVERMSGLLLPGVDYFQVVFTLPAELSGLLLGNRKSGYNLLFQSAWRALREVLEQDVGCEAAALLVLHTWNQRLEHHPHVHALVPGGGPGRQGGVWRRGRHPKHRRRKRPYLVDNLKLGVCFRRHYLAGLRRLAARGELRWEGASGVAFDREAFECWLNSLRQEGWVVHVEGPPRESSRPEHVLRYLARYLTGGPISDRRLISAESDVVRFWARNLDKGSRKRLVPFSLEGVEFVRRWALHILPKGFVKTRGYGGFGNRVRLEYLARCRAALGQAATAADAAASATSPQDEERDSPEVESAASTCRRCGKPMCCVWSAPRRSWREVFAGWCELAFRRGLAPGARRPTEAES